MGLLSSKKNVLLKVFIAMLLFFCYGCVNHQDTPVKTGLDRVHEYHNLFKNKRIGIITNHTGYNSEGKHIVDIFAAMESVEITALFGPEHGIRGAGEAGEKIASENDPIRNIPIYSLYGKTRKPTSEMLAAVDILVFDIQDIGARFYTYIYTMALAMEAAAEHGKKFVVLDRPNPISGTIVEGNILEEAFATFVGLYPIPVRHGLTAGELAQLFNEEGWLKNGVKANLTVIPLKNWQRNQWFDETGLRYIKPSPNMPNLASATTYPGICLLEGTNVSEGRGTEIPFQILGAPWIDQTQLAAKLNDLQLPGVAFRDTVFTPVSISGASTNPKHRNKICGGVFVAVKNREAYQSYLTGIHIVNTIHKLYPDSLKWRIKHFDRLCGTAAVRETIQGSGNIDSLITSWEEQFSSFMKTRKKYLIYE